jgi:hypothetical protein
MANNDAGGVLLFGGVHEDDFLHDTWTWDGENWKQEFPAKRPSGREAPSIASDASGHVVLFGGMNPSNRMLNETWIWDGKNWNQEFPADSPGARESASMACDASGGVVLFGGYPGFGATDLDDTWNWDGTHWTQLRTSSNPSARIVPSLAHSAPGQVILFGGLGRSVFRDTWVYQHGAGAPGNPKSSGHATPKLHASTSP